MKKIAVTQRVEIVPDYGERRDCLDQRWSELLIQCELHPVIFPNCRNSAAKIWANSEIEGLLLTGGNTLCEYGGDAPERDETERFLLQQALDQNLPVLGVCRGMQLLQHHFGERLMPIENHVGTRHQLQLSTTSRYTDLLEKIETVNAYHTLGSLENTSELQITAHSKDGVIMAVEHPHKKVFGQMWHSERDFPFEEEQLALFRRILGQEI